MQLEVRLVADVLGGLAGLGERRRLAVVVLVQLRQERLVGGLGEHALLLQDRQDAHRLQPAEKRNSFTAFITH